MTLNKYGVTLRLPDVMFDIRLSVICFWRWRWNPPLGTWREENQEFRAYRYGPLLVHRFERNLTSRQMADLWQLRAKCQWDE